MDNSKQETHTVRPQARRLTPLEDGLFHWLLVHTNQLQALPTAAVLAALILNALLVAFMWNTSYPWQDVILAAGSSFVFSALDWALLRALPRYGRSFGPDKPSALALSALRAILLALLAILSAPWWLAVITAGGLSALAFYATWIEPFRLTVTYESLKTAHWKAAAPPLRLLHIADLHLEHITPRERQLNALIKTLQPDVIVFSGDFVNLSYTDDPQTEQEIRHIIGEWRAPLGVYCVPGTASVEPMERVQAFTQSLENLRLLTNSWLTFRTPAGSLNILGMVTTHDLAQDRAMLRKLLLIAPRSGLKLLLTHAPDIAPDADALGIDLYLCGHTHGGQIRLPLIGALASASHLGKRFVMGRYEMVNATVYTSRGVGMEGLGAPRARFLCPPEIILWEIQGTS